MQQDKRPDGMMIDKGEKVCYVQEFKQELERHWGAQEQARQRAELQHGTLVRGSSKALDGSEWQVTLIDCLGCRFTPTNS